MLVVGFASFFVYLFSGSTDGLASDKARAQWPGLLMMLGFLVLALAGARFALNRRAVILSATELTIRTGFYGRTLRRSSLRPDSALQVSLLDRREFAPRWRTNGIALPGFRAGWFRLRNGDKALVLLTDPFNVTYLPTAEGYVLLISTSALLPLLREGTTAPTAPV